MEMNILPTNQTFVLPMCVNDIKGFALFQKLPFQWTTDPLHYLKHQDIFDELVLLNQPCQMPQAASICQIVCEWFCGPLQLLHCFGSRNLFEREKPYISDTQREVLEPHAAP